MKHECENAKMLKARRQRFGTMIELREKARSWAANRSKNGTGSGGVTRGGGKRYADDGFRGNEIKTKAWPVGRETDGRGGGW